MKLATYLLVVVNEGGDHEIIFVSNERFGELHARELSLGNPNSAVYEITASEVQF